MESAHWLYPPTTCFVRVTERCQHDLHCTLMGVFFRSASGVGFAPSWLLPAGSTAGTGTYTTCCCGACPAATETASPGCCGCCCGMGIMKCVALLGSLWPPTDD